MKFLSFEKRCELMTTVFCKLWDDAVRTSEHPRVADEEWVENLIEQSRYIVSDIESAAEGTQLYVEGHQGDYEEIGFNEREKDAASRRRFRRENNPKASGRD